MLNVLHELSLEFPNAVDQLEKLREHTAKREERLRRFAAFCALNDHLPMVPMYIEYEAALATASWQYDQIQEVSDEEAALLEQAKQNERTRRIERREKICEATASLFIKDPAAWLINDVADVSGFTFAQVRTLFLNRAVLTIATCEYLVASETL